MDKSVRDVLDRMKGRQSYDVWRCGCGEVLLTLHLVNIHKIECHAGIKKAVLVIGNEVHLEEP